jgi:hypothetical protein
MSDAEPVGSADHRSDPTECSERLRLWDVFDYAGRKWLEEVVRAFQ